MKILVVDDSNVSRVLLANLLAKRGHQAIAARDGAEALEMLAAGPVDLIVSDALMPKMDGFELCRRVKTDPATRDIPFVFYSADYISAQDEQFALSLGASRYLIKTGDPGAFLRSLEEVLANSPAAGSAPAPGEEQYLREYATRVVRKLEEKVAALEQTIAELQQSRYQDRELERLKADFVNVLSHELRTPLTSVLGFTEILLGGMAGGLTAEQRRFLDIIMRQTTTLYHLIEELLEFNLIKAGQRHVNIQPLQLRELVQAAVEGMQVLHEEHHLELRVDMAGEDLALDGDPDVLKRILHVLLSNAIKFTPQGGRVVVAARGTETQVAIQVADTGIGIPGDSLLAIFDSFRQLEEHNTRRYGGLGLGLAIAKQLVELHGGRIWAESEEGKGSTFTVVLPRRGFAAETEPAGIDEARSESTRGA